MHWLARILGLARVPRRGLTGRRAAAAPAAGRVLEVVEDAPAMLASELSRARRYEHALSIVVLSTTPLARAAEDQRPEPEAPDRDRPGVAGAPPDPLRSGETPTPQVAALLSAAALREVLRESDVVWYQPSDDRFVLAFVESQGEDARQALERVRTLFAERLALDVHAGIAHFPADGLTLEDLIAVADERIPGPEPSGEPAEAARGNGRPVGKSRRGPRFGTPALGSNA